ncbi:MAG: autotransporter outer membrane beta-barrel domain-containing protein [Pseudomonas sp.]|uniref:autotransporter outer membrane beta-barrel domain-containing protein n=1 Tax=Pseudomonas abieticivorans TaxID=2931382 RepID=UPI0020BD7945|nr:autotransporter outer membrane beta-barrel domain-containing protein [Pseudomonas sp. PIA16]MDE1167284.1 autotransporter outer membrane beta-barrel domain-containing protein [Pseudomonas sp.]
MYTFIKGKEFPVCCAAVIMFAGGFTATSRAAEVLVNEQRTVNTATGLDYSLFTQSQLDVTAGGKVAWVSSQAASTVNLSAGASAERILAQDSTVILTDSTVDTQGAATIGLGLSSSNATIANSTIMASNGIGIRVASVAGSTVRSSANVADSTITGTTSGAVVTLGSTLNLSNSTVRASEGDGVAIQGGGIVSASDNSVLRGRESGVSFDGSLFEGEGSLVLDHSQAVGEASSAISVVEGASASIQVNNQSTLKGADGNLLSVAGGSTALLSVNNSAVEGNVVNEVGSSTTVILQDQARLTGQMSNVSGLTVERNAQWLLTGDSTVNALTMSGGTVALGTTAQFYQLSLQSLEGAGTFAMSGDFVSGLKDLLSVSGQANGQYGLAFSSSGAEPQTNTSLKVVETGGGNAQFSLVGGTVDLGAFQYNLARHDNDWYLEATTALTPGARSVIALFNTAPTVWYGELSSLRSRMGELRLNGGQAGGWVRTYGNKYNISDASGVGYQQTQQGISLGADAPLPWGDGQWLIGVLGGYSKSDLDLDRGTSGTVHSYYAGLYSTWLDPENGYYFDGVVKVNRFSNQADVALSDGSISDGKYDNSGVGASVEFGRHIALSNQYFIEPFGQVSGVVIQGRNYSLDNGMQAQGDRARSLLSKVGSTVGRTYDLGPGRYLQPYVKAAWVHEFAKNNEVQVNNNVFNNDLSGSRGELGFGVALSLSERAQVHADFDYSNGNGVEQPWGGNIGVRFAW